MSPWQAVLFDRLGPINSLAPACWGSPSPPLAAAGRSTPAPKAAEANSSASAPVAGTGVGVVGETGAAATVNSTVDCLLNGV